MLEVEDTEGTGLETALCVRQNQTGAKPKWLPGFAPHQSSKHRPVEETPIGKETGRSLDLCKSMKSVMAGAISNQFG